MAKWIKVISRDDFKQDSILFIYKDYKIALFKLDDGIYAINDECSHEYASLSEGYIDGDRVECPQHGAQFDIKTGKNLSFPAVTPVESYPIKVDDDFVYIQLDE